MREPEGNRLLGGPRRRWKDITILDLQETGGSSWVGFVSLRIGTDGGLHVAFLVSYAVFINSSGLHIGRASTFVFCWSQKCVQPALICTTQPFPLMLFSDVSL